ncbi:MAG: TIGR04255 family protein [Planctomycetota bacterium]
MTNLPSYANPPVVETATSIQFPRSRNLRNQHLWEYWFSFLRDKYPNTSDQFPLDPIMEATGENAPLHNALPTIRPAAPEDRIQATTNSGRGMVQLQNGRVIYNWRKLDGGEYPRWDKTYDQFINHMNHFFKYLSDISIGPVQPNQWEVVYVNHLMQGIDWDSESDWPNLLPGIFSKQVLSSIEPESINLQFQYKAQGFNGRFYISLEKAVLAKDRDKELLVLKLTSRGGIPKGSNIHDQFLAGRQLIVETFDSVTSEDAHKRWGKESA